MVLVYKWSWDLGSGSGSLKSKVLVLCSGFENHTRFWSTSKLCACLTFKPFLAGEINAAKQSELNILTDEVACVQVWLMSLEREKVFCVFHSISYGML